MGSTVKRDAKEAVLEALGEAHVVKTEDKTPYPYVCRSGHPGASGDVVVLGIGKNEAGAWEDAAMRLDGKYWQED